MSKMPIWVKLTAGLVVLVVGFFIFRPSPIDVEIGNVEMRPFFEAIEEQEQKELKADKEEKTPRV